MAIQPPAIMEPSAITTRIAQSGAKSSAEALPIEILHNLEYQHKWSNLSFHQLSKSQNIPLQELTSTSTLSKGNGPVLISGFPPRHSYIHPDFLSHLVQHSIEESSIPIQKEYVLPASIGETWTLKRFAEIFDSLPQREARVGHGGYVHKDSKRVLLAMLGHNGMGGDGTIVYYIMQEGEVKPRQN